MSTSHHPPIAFLWKTKEINNLKWAATKKLFLDIILLSKIIRHKYIIKFGQNPESEKLLVSDKSMFGGVNNSSMVMSSSVKCMGNYSASRLAHYQDQIYEETINVGSMRPSRRSSNLSGFSVSSQHGTACLQPTQEQFHKLLISDEMNNNIQNLTTDDAPSNMHGKITQTSKSSNSKGESKPNNPQTDVPRNIKPPDTIQGSDMYMSLHTQTTLEATELSNIRSRANPISRNNQSSRACYFCWCCCCSCSCLNIIPTTDEPSHPPISNDPRSKLEAISTDEKITLEEAQKWCHNFDLLMQSSAGRRVFHEFLKLEYSEENIMFYRAVEELQLETNMDLIEEKARAIYEDYISILSPKEVSLDSRVRELINSQMVEPSSHTFDEAQLQIFTLMQRDSYPRFLNSRLYKDFLHQLGGSSTTSNSQSITESRPNNSS